VETTKVLVVDDSKLIHRMFEMMLRDHSIVHAMDGREGLQVLGENADIGIIFLDVNMPQMNGLEFLQEVRQSAAFADVPIVMVSTEGKDEDTTRALDAGATAYIKKPFQAHEVTDVLSHIGTLQPEAPEIVQADIR